MRALTIRQPWADAIVHGTKRTENRSWPAPVRYLGTAVLIHAAKSAEPAALPAQLAADWPGMRGALLAYADLTGCHPATGCCRPWGEPHAWHWQLTRIRPLPKPIPCRGALGLWTPPPDLLHTINRED